MRGTSWRALLVLGIGGTSLTAGSTMSNAQTLSISSDVACASCSIETTEVARLPVELPLTPTRMARDPAGLFYFVERDRLLRVYASDGRLLRQIGRRGGGPGEYEVLRNVGVAGDRTIHVIDAALARRSQFSAEGKFLMSAPVRFQGGQGMPAVLLPDGQFIVNVAPSVPGAPILQRVDKQGNNTLDLERASADPRQDWLQFRLLVLRSNGDLLVARPWTFEIEAFGKTLARKQQIRRVADWIPTHGPVGPPDDGVFDRQLTPQLQAMWEDSEGVMWLHMVVPSPSWKPQPQDKSVKMTEELFATLAGRPRFQAILEAVDLERGIVLARSRSDVAVGMSLGGGYFARRTEDSAGNPSAVITRVQLKRK